MSVALGQHNCGHILSICGVHFGFTTTVVIASMIVAFWPRFMLILATTVECNAMTDSSLLPSSVHVFLGSRSPWSWLWPRLGCGDKYFSLWGDFSYAFFHWGEIHKAKPLSNTDQTHITKPKWKAHKQIPINAYLCFKISDFRSMCFSLYVTESIVDVFPSTFRDEKSMV